MFWIPSSIYEQGYKGWLHRTLKEINIQAIRYTAEWTCQWHVKLYRCSQLLTGRSKQERLTGSLCRPKSITAATCGLCASLCVRRAQFEWCTVGLHRKINTGDKIALMDGIFFRVSQVMSMPNCIRQSLQCHILSLWWPKFEVHLTNTTLTCFKYCMILYYHKVRGNGKICNFQSQSTSHDDIHTGITCMYILLIYTYLCIDIMNITVYGVVSRVNGPPPMVWGGG